MMNKNTRKLSKMPDEVRAEIGPYFIERNALVDEDSRKLPKLDDDTAHYAQKGLTVSSKSFFHSFCLNPMLFLSHSCLPCFVFLPLLLLICSLAGVTSMLISMSTMSSTLGGF